MKRKVNVIVHNFETGAATPQKTKEALKKLTPKERSFLPEMYQELTCMIDEKLIA